MLNILPESIANCLKDDETLIADQFDEVTVLFADIVGFTPLSTGMKPEQLVDLLNRVFSKFDDLAITYGLEKIKIIGDAYMVAGGLPERTETHAVAVANMALDMQADMKTCNGVAGHNLVIRIGINTEPVVAGVIGKKKFTYDLWGDTVNTASRMESSCVPGKIQVTEATSSIILLLCSVFP